MLINIHKAILHILDFNSGVTVFSEQELDITSGSVMDFLTKHIEKAYQNQSAKTGTFLPNSRFKEKVTDYLAGMLDFISFSVYAADLMYTAIAQSDVTVSTDVIICDFTIDSNRMLGLLKCNNKIGFIHQVVQENGKIKNDIINHYAILPGLSQKFDEYALIDATTLAITFVDKKRLVNGVETYVIADQILECSSRISPKETIEWVSTITRTVAESHGLSTVEAVAKAKHYIVENTGISERLDPVALGKEVFSDSPMMQAEYIKAVESAGITETVKVDKDFAVKKGKNHKIKTDTGIELTFPVDYFQSNEYIEFINHPNGTISIQL